MKSIQTIEDLEMCLNGLYESALELNGLSSVKTQEELFFTYGIYRQLSWQYLLFLQEYCTYHLPNDLEATQGYDVMADNIIEEANEQLNDNDLWFNLSAVFLYINDSPLCSKKTFELNQYEITWHIGALEFAFNNLLKINEVVIDIIKTNYNRRREV